MAAGAIPGLLILGSVKKQAEQAINSNPPWPLLQLLLPASCAA